jgi:MATE family multidrug resistance protein
MHFLNDVKAPMMKSIIKLGFPVVVSNLGLILMALFDTAMIGWYGEGETAEIPLAAAGISNAVFFVASIFGIGVLVVFSSMYAGYIASGKINRLGKFINASLVVNVVISVLTFVLLQLLLQNIDIFKQPLDVELEAKPYFNILTYSIWPMFLFLSFKNISDGYSLTKAAMFASLTAVVLNVGLNYCLIFGNFGAPELGLVGAGYGTLISRIYMAIFMILYIQYNQQIAYKLSELKEGFLRTDLIRLLRIGIPSGLQFFYEISAFAGAAILTGWISSNDLAAHNVVIGLVSFTYMFANGISVAGLIKAGEATGRKDHNTTRQLGVNALVLTTACMAVFAIFIVVFNQTMVGWFTSKQEVIEIASTLMIVAAFFQLSDGIQAVSLGLLRGMHDTKIPARITFIVYWLITLPLCYILGFTYGLQTVGIWIGLLVGLTLAALLLTIRFWKKTHFASHSVI